MQESLSGQKGNCGQWWQSDKGFRYHLWSQVQLQKGHPQKISRVHELLVGVSFLFGQYPVFAHRELNKQHGLKSELGRVWFWRTRTRPGPEKIGLSGPGPEKRPGEVLPFVFINIVKKHCFLCTHLPLLVPLPNNWLLFYNKHWEGGGGVTASVCFQDIYKWTSQTISSGYLNLKLNTLISIFGHFHQHFYVYLNF